MVFYLSGMQNIEYSIYEAAKIDGASPLQTFFKITVPLLKPMILLTTITSTNGTLQLFDESLNLTNGELWKINHDHVSLYLQYVLCTEPELWLCGSNVHPDPDHGSHSGTASDESR